MMKYKVDENGMYKVACEHCGHIVIGKTYGHMERLLIEHNLKLSNNGSHMAHVDWSLEKQEKNKVSKADDKRIIKDNETTGENAKNLRDLCQMILSKGDKYKKSDKNTRGLI